jgi:hypothetical protein
MDGESTNLTACPRAVTMCLIAALIATVAGGFIALSMFTFVASGSANAADMWPSRNGRIALCDRKPLSAAVLK